MQYVTHWNLVQLPPLDEASCWEAGRWSSETNHTLWPRSAGIISQLKNIVGWFFVREKYCSAWKNKLNKTDYKPDEQGHWHVQLHTYARVFEKPWVRVRHVQLHTPMSQEQRANHTWPIKSWKTRTCWRTRNWRGRHAHVRERNWWTINSIIDVPLIIDEVWDDESVWCFVRHKAPWSLLPPDMLSMW
jgi:hypothetical protein